LGKELNFFSFNFITEGGFMNLRKLVVLIALLACATVMFAQFATFTSFRALSTANVLESDIEAIMTAAELPYVDGFNVYTNLSNFNYSSEYLFDGYSPNFLVGFKGDFSNMLHAGVLIASQNDMYTYENAYTEIENRDSNGDEIYDVYARYTDSSNYMEVDQYDDNYFGFAFGQKDATKIGFSYSRGAYKYLEIYNDVYFDIDSNLISGNYTSSYNGSNGDYYTENGVYQDFAFSVYQPFGSMEAGFIFKYGPFTELDTESYYDSMYTSGEPTSTNPRYFDRYVEDYAFNAKYNATRIVLGAVFFQRMNEDSLEFGMNYTNINQPNQPVTEVYNESYYETYPTVIDPYTYSYTYTETAGDSSYSKETENSFFVYLKYIKKLDKAMFGLGVAYMGMSSSYEECYMYDYSYTENYNDGNGIDDAGDYTITESANYTYLDQGSSNNNVFVLPVGLEYNVWGNFSFRLGATTYFVWQNAEMTERNTEFNPGTGVYEDLSGYTYEYLLSDPTYRYDYSGNGSSFYKYTEFTYGASFAISENVAIDLMHFNDLTDLTNWQLSAKVKF